MFDSFIYRLLDKIVNWCERYREYKIKKSLPKSSPDEVKNGQVSVKSLINNNDTDYIGNTNTIIRLIRRIRLWILKH